MRRGGKPWKKLKAIATTVANKVTKLRTALKSRKLIAITVRRITVNVSTVAGENISQENLQGRMNKQKACLLEQ
jgi:hypothetical protein